MYLQWIEIDNYRNLDGIKIHFHQDLNYFVGENAIGKTNFLDLLSILSQGHGFKKEDFDSLAKPIRINLGLAPDAAHVPDARTRIFRLEQKVDQAGPSVSEKEDHQWKSVDPSILRHVMYLYHKNTTEQELYKLEPAIYEAIGSASVRRLLDYLESTLRKDLGPRYSRDNVRLFISIAVKILAQMYLKFQNPKTSAEKLVNTTKDGRRYLSIFISVDEPEIHLSPYLQRSLLSYYNGIITNQNKAFLKLLKVLFKLDGLDGQLFIVTHSTDALVDDYRCIIRFYRNLEDRVRAACGVSFNFPKEIEKHLIMHFPEAKEALYARVVIIVEGETEYGCFRGFGRTLDVNFDYFGICLINARGESSIEKLTKLFSRFAIPVVSLYDRDVMDKRGEPKKNVFFTDEICYEMELVSYLIHLRHRDVLDQIVGELLDGGLGLVTHDMLHRSLGKLGLDYRDYKTRQLNYLPNGQGNLLRIYYFAWFYNNKGISVGRTIAKYLTKNMIPPVFKKLIERAKELSEENLNMK